MSMALFPAVAGFPTGGNPSSLCVWVHHGEGFKDTILHESLPERIYLVLG